LILDNRIAARMYLDYYRIKERNEYPPIWRSSLTRRIVR